MKQTKQIAEETFCYHCGHSRDFHPGFLCQRADDRSDDGSCRCRGWRERTKPGDLGRSTG